MVGGDDQAGVQVEAVGVGSLVADTGVEVELVAAESLGLLGEPGEQVAAMSASPRLGSRREVVDIEVVAPGEVVTDAKARDRGSARLPVVEGRDEPVPLASLNLVHPADELFFASQVGAESAHGLEGKASLRWQQLADHMRILRLAPDRVDLPWD